MMSFEHKTLGEGNQAQAEKSLLTLKNGLLKKGQKIDTEMEKYQHSDDGVRKVITVRGLKQLLRNVCQLTSYDTENLVEFLDKANTGYIACVEIIKLVK